MSDTQDFNICMVDGRFDQFWITPGFPGEAHGFIAIRSNADINTSISA